MVVAESALQAYMRQRKEVSWYVTYAVVAMPKYSKYRAVIVADRARSWRTGSGLIKVYRYAVR